MISEFIIVIAGYFTIIGLVYKFKANILINAFAFLQKSNLDYRKSGPKLL